MPSLLPAFSFLWASLIITNAIPLVSPAKTDKSTQRNLDSPIHSILLTKRDFWYNFVVISDPEDSDDLYMPNGWALSLHSNETIISNGGCPLFGRFSCSSPDCHEDTTSLYSLGFPTFLSGDATCLNLTSQTISIAGGAWKINSSPLYMHSCESFEGTAFHGTALGQIGLGLSGKAYQNFQTINPGFSIIIYNKFSAELIFGFNSSYVDETKTSISIPCDLNWNVRVNRMTIGNSTFVDHPTTLIFDLGTGDISLPPAYYTTVRTYLFQTSGPGNCVDQPKSHSFYCLHHGDINDLPSLALNLENGTQFVLSPITYTVEYQSIYMVRFCQYNSTFSGVEYIVLGRRTMFNYYTVFEQLGDQTHTITFYPVTHTSLNSSFEEDQALVYPNRSEAFSESNSPRQNDTAPNITLETNASSSLPETKDNSNITEVQSSDNSSIIQTETPLTLPKDKTENSTYIMYAILIVIFIGLICGYFVYFCIKRPKDTHDKMVKEHRPTLELNESSYFVSSNVTAHVDHEKTMSE